MITLEKIYIFGHKKPDTDSVTASIALSYLKNQLGFSTTPRVLGDVNNETKFVLQYWKVKEPKYLNDVRLQIKDIQYLKDFHMNGKYSIMDGLNYMNEQLVSTLPIVDNYNKFKGLVSMKDIAKSQIMGDINQVNTSYSNLIKSLSAEEILKFDEEIKGNILVASYRSTTFIENVKLEPDTILIVGDRHSVIEYAIASKIKMIILTNNSEIKDHHLKQAELNGVNIIRSPYDTFKTSRKIGLANYLDNISFLDSVISFQEEEDLKDFVDFASKTKYSNYPILNKNNECLGILRLSDINDKKRKQVILVDHNEPIQSVDGLEEAEIIEIVDHHKIGTIGTSTPINFRTMTVGSSNTIIAMLYKENHIEIPSHIAGLMLSGIISDTLLFKSPTTTNLDIETVIDLSKIANIDYEKYGMEMLKAGASLKGKTKEEVLYMDFKNFTIDNDKIGVAQIFITNIEEIMTEKDEYVALIDSVAQHNDYKIVVLFATDIITNGSYMFFNHKAKDILDNAFDLQNIEQGHYLPDVVSRKKQIIPNIINALEKK